MYICIRSNNQYFFSFFIQVIENKLLIFPHKKLRNFPTVCNDWWVNKDICVSVYQLLLAIHMYVQPESCNEYIALMDFIYIVSSAYTTKQALVL